MPKAQPRGLSSMPNAIPCVRSKTSGKSIERTHLKLFAAFWECARHEQLTPTLFMMLGEDEAVCTYLQSLLHTPVPMPTKPAPESSQLPAGTPERYLPQKLPVYTSYTQVKSDLKSRYLLPTRSTTIVIATPGGKASPLLPEGNTPSLRGLQVPYYKDQGAEPYYRSCRTLRESTVSNQREVSNYTEAQPRRLELSSTEVKSNHQAQVGSTRGRTNPSLETSHTYVMCT